MPLPVTTRRLIILVVVIVIGLIASGIAFVSYFMHAVYETEQLIDEVQVPAAVRENFAKQFPNAAAVIWEFEDNLYEAEFRTEEHPNVEVRFTPEGAWAQTVYPVRFRDLPEKARAYLQSQDGYRVIEEEKIELPGLTHQFEAKLANQLMEWNCLFDAEGNLVSRTRDGPVLE